MLLAQRNEVGVNSWPLEEGETVGTWSDLAAVVYDILLRFN
jgi:hypothetical protein